MAFVNKVNTGVNHNNKDKMFEDMDVDDVEIIFKKNTTEDGSEEGEVSGDEDTDGVFSTLEAPVENKRPERRFDNRAGGFITGIDVFGKEEQARLIERAKRFGLDSSNTHTLSEKELKKLYWSVGANEEDSDKKFRFDSLTMYGTEAMSTKDIFEYFSDYAPSSIEWLSDNSCNVIWLDNLSAVRALIGLSKPVKYPSSTKSSNSKNNMKKGSTGTSSKDQESDIIMLDDDSSEETRDTEDFAAEIAADPEAVDEDELGFDVPPGRWRKGKIHPHSDSILIRFALRSNGSAVTEQDGRPTRLHQPVFGMVGLISNSKKELIKQGLLVRPKHFQDDMGDERDFVISSDEDEKANPWGTLAKSWGHIDRARRPIETYDDVFNPYSTSPPPPALMLPPLPPPSIRSRIGFPKPSGRLHRPRRGSPVHSISPDSERPHALRNRPYQRHEERDLVGRNRSRREKSLSLSPSPEPPQRRQPEKRKRRESSEKSFDSDSDSDEEWKKRVKVPRMRMYADEEEKRSKERAKVVSRSDNIYGRTDLRNRLQNDRSGRSRRTSPPSSSHRARSPYRREDSRRRYDRESARRPTRNGESVWLRLEKPSSVSSAIVRAESEAEYGSTSYDSPDSSDSEPDSILVKSTVHRRIEEDDYPPFSNGRSSLTEDLRSKLNKKKSASTMKRRSPLRIEIDNDEYYRHADRREK